MTIINNAARTSNHLPTGNPVRALSKREFVESFVPPDWQAVGIFQRHFIYALTGQTGHSKTAVAIHFAELVSSVSIDNPMFGPHQVMKGNVLYLVGENQDDHIMRIIGADKDRGEDRWNDRIQFVPGIISIANSLEGLAATAAQMRGVHVVVVDTSAAYFEGFEEASNVQMGEHARILRLLTKLPGEPTVLVLCHPTKYATEVEQLVPRGGYNFLCQMDGNLTIRKIRPGSDIVQLAQDQNKWRGPGFDPIHFRLEKITTPRLLDSNGRPLTTVRAVLVDETEIEASQNKVVDDEDRVLTAMLAEPGISLAGIADRWSWRYATGKPDKSRVQRALERLEKDKLVKSVRNVYELTEAGKAAARKAAYKYDIS